jgi:hypothetical protein
MTRESFAGVDAAQATRLLLNLLLNSHGRPNLLHLSQGILPMHFSFRRRQSSQLETVSYMLLEWQQEAAVVVSEVVLTLFLFSLFVFSADMGKLAGHPYPYLLFHILQW